MKERVITVHSHIGYLGDFETEWWTEEDWRKYRQDVKRLKREGIFGKPITNTIIFKEIEGLSNGGNDIFDFSGMGLIIPNKG
jgi:hypothetical protein